jgi:hypothetical protein
VFSIEWRKLHTKNNKTAEEGQIMNNEENLK